MVINRYADRHRKIYVHNIDDTCALVRFSYYNKHYLMYTKSIKEIKCLLDEQRKNYEKSNGVVATTAEAYLRHELITQIRKD
ncbi:MAG: hypothetical protein J6W49_01945, partial [Paludibacteraceae bacterium]|nr:hypothetical protein [Paludibacteraceae bacterium]